MINILRGIGKSAVLAMLVAGCMTTLSANRGLAQTDEKFSLALLGGVTSYDLAGTGTVGTALGSVSYPVLPFFVVESSIGYLRYANQGGPSHNALLMPEASLQIQWPGTTFNPYFGAGAGLAFVVEGRSDTDTALHAALGARLRLNEKWSARTEARLRSVDPFVGTTFGILVGLSRQI